MIQTRLFEHNAEFGYTKWWHYDPDTDEAWIETKWDLEAYGEIAKDGQNNDTGRFNDGMHRVAQIPMALYQKLKTQGVFDDKRAFRRWFQSDEAAPFKLRKMWV